MATSSSALLLLLAASSSSVFSGCEAFAPPRTTTSLSSTSPFSSPPTDGAILPSSSPMCFQGNQNFCLSRNINSSRKDTSLSMGIRSFIKRKILRRGKGEDDEDGDNGDSDADDVSLHSILQSPGSAGLMEMDDAEDDYVSEGDNDASLKKKSAKKASKKYVEKILNTDMDREMYEETTDRIRRMKGGGMTEEEKAQFLSTALTRTIPKKPRGPVIRQTIPGLDDAQSSGGKGKNSSGKKSGAASSSTENLWNAITRKDGKKDAPANISVTSLMMDGKMKDEEAKQRYMDSITNPDRFATFSAYQQSTPSEVEDQDDDEYDDIVDYNAEEEELDVEGSAAEYEDVSEIVVTDGTDFTEMKRQIAEDRELLNPSQKQEGNAARDAVESILSMISSNNDKKATPAESNVVASEKKQTDHLAARLGQAAEEQEKREAEARLEAELEATKKREDEKRARAEVQRQREEEARRREVERMEKARIIAEEERRKVEEKASAERAALEARQAQQDDYWAKMLNKEQERKQQSEPIDITRKKEVIARDSKERVERDVAKDVTRENIRNEERAREDPHEGEILKEAAEAKLRDRERVRDIEEVSAARVTRTVPQPPKKDVSVSSFVQEQRRKQEEIDRLRQLDTQLLKSLNSPLPSPGKAPVGMPPSPFRAPPPVVARPPPAPAPARPSSPALSLASLTMAKKSEGSGSAPASPPPAPPRLNLFEMTKLKKDSDSSTSSATATPAAKKRPPAAKRVVRQQVAILGDDDEDDDDDDMMRSGAPGLTVADALKKQRKSGGGTPGGKKMTADDKAKAWGIDMSKFK
eukprot:CAMPEP_0172314108 /NCGR_PEP_ID=MMETSP1058-20130122/21693_1 /TAXON_ID=83371 /ORGANISM="Detonula confervacea, Strain CCMP 353" /LENGTH=812 /DNA_ID=CAMNT_0013027887 /DNA_START=131 /DNA_END=2569 /DNA_ORIENTATION=+